MKISPVAKGAILPANMSEGRSASPDRMARATAAGAGQNPAQVQIQHQTQTREQQQNSNELRRMKMKVDYTPGPRDGLIEQVQETTQQTVANPNAQVNTADSVVQANTSAEDTANIDPQAARILKAERALQVREQAYKKQISDIQAQLDQAKTAVASVEQDVMRDPLGFLQKRKIGYDRLTQDVLKSMEENPNLIRLEDTVKSLQEQLAATEAKASKLNADAETETLAEMRKEADELIGQGDAFELVRTAGAKETAIRLIQKTLDKTGEMLSVQDALELVENDLLERQKALSAAKKIQAGSGNQTTQTQAQSQGQGQRGMTTLQSTDTARPKLSPRERALIASRTPIK